MAGRYKVIVKMAMASCALGALFMTSCATMMRMEDDSGKMAKAYEDLFFKKSNRVTVSKACLNIADDNATIDYGKMHTGSPKIILTNSDKTVGDGNLEVYYIEFLSDFNSDYNPTSGFVSKSTITRIDRRPSSLAIVNMPLTYQGTNSKKQAEERKKLLFGSGGSGIFPKACLTTRGNRTTFDFSKLKKGRPRERESIKLTADRSVREAYDVSMFGKKNHMELYFIDLERNTIEPVHRSYLLTIENSPVRKEDVLGNGSYARPIAIDVVTFPLQIAGAAVMAAGAMY